MPWQTLRTSSVFITSLFSVSISSRRLCVAGRDGGFSVEEPVQGLPEVGAARPARQRHHHRALWTQDLAAGWRGEKKKQGAPFVKCNLVTSFVFNSTVTVSLRHAGGPQIDVKRAQIWTLFDGVWSEHLHLIGMRLASLLCIFSYVDRGRAAEGKSIQSVWPLKGQSAMRCCQSPQIHHLEKQKQNECRGHYLVSWMLAPSLSLPFIIYYINMIQVNLLLTVSAIPERPWANQPERL